MEHANANPSDGGAPVVEESLEQLIVRLRAEGNPWVKAAGIFKDDPLFDEWVGAMRGLRQQADSAQETR